MLLLWNWVCRHFNHLGVLFDSRCRDQVTINARKRKFFAAMNSVVSRLGGTCLNDDTWKKIVDTVIPCPIIWRSLMESRKDLPF